MQAVDDKNDGTAPREMCYRCFWPKAHCWCHLMLPLPTRTRFVFLMHLKEYKRTKAATGRLTQRCLPNSELHMGLSFDDNRSVRRLIDDPKNMCALLYPTEGALDLCAGELGVQDLAERQLVIFLLDGTWSQARKMLRHSTCLHDLPRLSFGAAQPSRWLIKKQPRVDCLSTLEAVHELLLALQAGGLDRYERPEMLLTLFAQMQQFQIRCAQDPSLDGYRRTGWTPPQARAELRTANARRRPVVPRESAPQAAPALKR